MIFMSLQKRHLVSIIFLAAISVHFLSLYIATATESFDWLEALKLFGPIFILGCLSLLGRRIQLLVVKSTVYVLAMHIGLGIAEALLRGVGSLQSEDGRMIIELLGRGSGETAWAICVALATLNFLKDQQYIEIRAWNHRAITLVSIIVVVLTQTRSAILFLAVYYLHSNRTNFNAIQVARVSVIILSIVIIAAFTPYFSELIQRTLSPEKVLTGREYIWAAQIMALTNQDITAILFGSDLTPKVREVSEITYITADPHNLFIDIFQYYGFAGLLYILVWYKYQTKSNSKGATQILMAFVVMSMFVSTFRYPMLFYINVALLLIPMIQSKKSNQAAIKKIILHSRSKD